jgi:hypothetical protein
MIGDRRSYRTVRGQALHYLARPHRAVPRHPISGPAAWQRADFPDDDAWSDRLGADDLAEIEAALARATAPLAMLCAGDVPLPRLASRIRTWRAELTRGRGFVRIRGVPVERWPERDVERLFWALGQHLGRPGAQNGDGDLLGHVRDLRLGRDGQVRQYKTREAIPFHCDAADAVGLLCLRPAERGGRSRIASSVTIFNRILETRPDLAPLLFEPMCFDSRGDGGTDVFTARPAAFDGDRLRTFYHGEYMRTASRHHGVPPLTAPQRELLDLYDELAGSPALCLEMDFQPGDIQLISNHTVVHSRTAYTDADDPDRRRHLLRLWLTLEAPGSLADRARRARSLAELLAGQARRTVFRKMRG